MISLWITIGLVLAAIAVSSLGAFFSIVGLGVLFSGAPVAVWVMAGALEFAKFILAAYLHQAWKQLGYIYKSYLTFAVITLSIITSIGIFGFLSDAYQSSTSILDSQNVSLENLQNQQKFFRDEIARLTKSVEEIPESRVTKRLKMRAEVEPRVLELTKKLEENEKTLGESKLKSVDIKKRVGPLIFIAKAFNMEIDAVVRLLIIIFVTVFDPLAICLVIASTQAIDSRKNGIKEVNTAENKNTVTPLPVESLTKVADAKLEVVPDEAVAHEAPASVEVKAEPIQTTSPADDDIVVQMNFKEAGSENAPVENSQDNLNESKTEDSKKAV